VSLDLHPEELLHQRALRELAPEEQADLDAHVARCSACALHVKLLPVLARAAKPSAADYALAARAVERLFAGDAPAFESLPPRAVGRASGGARLAMRVAIVVALLLGTGVGASALVGHLRARAVVAPTEVEPAPVARRAGRARSAAAPAVAPTELPPEPAPAELVVAPRAPVAPAAPPARPRPRAPSLAPSPAPATSPSTAAVAAPAEVVDDEAATAIAAPADADAATLFARAERAQRRREIKEAAALYRELMAKHPGAREEIAARALFGQLLLDQLGQPRAALDLFDRYLRDEPAGVLVEEAEVGRAEALERLGETGAARATWQSFLRRYPSSVHAKLARKRLEASGGDAP
jgi:TolA-binding protein